MDSAEKRDLEVRVESSSSDGVKLDHHGLPLIPQPSDDPEDPLNWSRGQKYIIVAIASLVAFLGGFALASSNPAYAQIGLALDVSAIEASYIGTIGIASGGIRSFVWAPISNVYGRRPVLIFSQAIGIAAGLGAAYAKSYGGNVVTFAIVSDLFCLHERGKMLGLVTVALINGPHVVSLPAGFIAQNVGWQWTIILPSVLTSVCWVLIILAMPETLYVRGQPPVDSPGKYYRMRITGTKAVDRKLQLVDFARPFQMLKYFPVAILGWFAAVAFTLGRQVTMSLPIDFTHIDIPTHFSCSVMPAQTVSALFRTYYKWGSARTGVALSVSTTIGGVLGEVVSGPVIDKLIARSRKRTGRVRPESRSVSSLPYLLPLLTMSKKGLVQV
ncbi:major facilitator superfamily domain-containing protein [Mycena capillaripes]|nr:major facilitator superfamily domain-containing protein [Mycena capillaripes]